VVGAPALGRIHNQGGMHPQAVANQVVMHRPNGQQRRNIAGFGTQGGGIALRHPPGRSAPESILPALTAASARSHSASTAWAKTLRAGGNGKQGRQGGRLKLRLADLLQLNLIDDRTFHVQQPGKFRLFFQQVALGAKLSRQGHHQPLPSGGQWPGW
jgi:hypothetical protein